MTDLRSGATPVDAQLVALARDVAAHVDDGENDVLTDDDLLADPLTIQGGYLRVPEGPGLGITIDELHERAVLGVQSAAGYDEGRPLHASW